VKVALWAAHVDQVRRPLVLPDVRRREALMTALPPGAWKLGSVTEKAPVWSATAWKSVSLPKTSRTWSSATACRRP
jgi:hypothetical protein